MATSELVSLLHPFGDSRATGASIAAGPGWCAAAHEVGEDA